MSSEVIKPSNFGENSPPESEGFKNSLVRIREGSPLWWSIDHEPDPREYMAFEEFRSRVVYAGKLPGRYRNSLLPNEGVEKDMYLYPYPRVPISIVDLEVADQQLSFMVTARPYHKKEEPGIYLYGNLPSNLDFEKKFPSVDELKDFVKDGGEIGLLDQWYPHIRGLFVGRRGNNFFWHPMGSETYFNWKEFGKPLVEALKKNGLSWLSIYVEQEGGKRRYPEVWEELGKKMGLVDIKRPKRHNFSPDKVFEVGVDQFLEGYKDKEGDYLLYYPLRLPGISHTIPLVIATRTHQESGIRKPVVLGVFAENGLDGRCRKGGILRIKNREMAEDVSRLISKDFGVEVDTVLFTPRKGRPLYERV